MKTTALAIVAAPLFVGASASQAAGADWSVMPPEVCAASSNDGCGQYSKYALAGVIPELKNKGLPHAEMSIWFNSHPQYHDRLKRLYDARELVCGLWPK